MKQSATEQREAGSSAARQNKAVRLEELEGVRALAALWVFGFHVWQFGGSPEWTLVWAGATWDLFWILKQGPSGVDLFMVLSGLCLFWPVVSRAGTGTSWNWRQYLWGRARRIVPAYYAAIAYAVFLPIALVGLVRAWGWEARMQPIPSWWQIWTHLAFVHTFFADTWDGVTGAFWSMGLEAQFYLTFPLLVWAWKRNRWGALWMTMALSVLYRAGVEWWLPPDAHEERFLWSITFVGRWMQFVVGMMVSALLASLRGSIRDRLGGRRLWLLVAGAAAVWAGLSPAMGAVREFPVRDLLLSFGYGLLLFALLVVPWRWRRIFAGGALAKLGVFSYSFFLIHQPTAWYFMELVRKRLGVSGPWQVAVGLSAGLLVTAAVSWAFAWVFEGAAVRARLRGGTVARSGGSPRARAVVETV